MEHGAHLGLLGDNPLLVLAAIFLLGFLIIARLAAAPVSGADHSTDDAASAESGHGTSTQL
jgi:hypothetical protein